MSSIEYIDIFVLFVIRITLFVEDTKKQQIYQCTKIYKYEGNQSYIFKFKSNINSDHWIVYL